VAGKKTKCPQCGAIVEVPSPDAAAPDTDYALNEPAPAVDDEYGLRPASQIIPAPRSEPRAPRPAKAVEWKPPSASMPAAARPAAKPKSGGSGTHTILEYAYLLLVFALVPLVVSLLGEDKNDLPERIDQTLEHATPQEQTRALPVLIKMQAGEPVGKDELLAVMPGGKLAGAHLAYDSPTHWVYAGIATAGFLLLISLFFSVERVNPVHLVLVGLFTGTVGIILLLAVQFCSQFRMGRIHARGWFVVIMLILAFIGWSYRSALDDDSNFFLSALGFTFGVGLCEEFTKAIPLFFYFKRYAQMGWRGACLWGLASGIGFGVSEGITYASGQYNGLLGADIYLVRFISCVALHAMWSASVGIAIARNVDDYEQVSDFFGFLLFMLRIIAVPMLLHGFYDTLLKKDMNAWALAVALLSFGWLVMHIEMARGSHPQAGTGRRKFAY
jgi:RsiW-degrading membrane proteinase PrsW (M82 family)